MAYPDPVMTSTRPRLVILKGSVPLEAQQIQALKTAFDVVEVHSVAAARKMLDGSVGGVVVCAPGEYLSVGGEPLPTAAATILQHIGEGIAVVDAQGGLLWTDARFKIYDEHLRSEFIRNCRTALEHFNASAEQSNVAAQRQSRRFGFPSHGAEYEVIVAPASIDQAQDRVTSVVGVLWEVSAARKLQQKLDAIDAAGADLLQIESAAVDNMNMAERLKLLEQKIVRYAHELLNFDNFEVRLLDRETGQLELVIAENISPLKIGEVIYARPQGNGISGYVASVGRSYICPDVQHDPLYREGLDKARSSLTVPLLLQDRVIGTFNIESFELNAFDDNDRKFAEIFGRYIAVAMHVLDLLVIERFTTNERMAQNVVAEMGQPLADLTAQVNMLRQTHEADQGIVSVCEQMLKTLNRVRSRLECCTAGPRSILGAEQEMQRHEIDPLLAGRHILIADDEPAIRETLSEMLTQKGAHVTLCTTGSQTIDVLNEARRKGERFDMVLSDIKMPDRNGYEVYRLAKELDPGIPVVLMTGFGYDPHHCIVRASQEGLQSFLFKPFKASQLMEVLAKNLAGR